MSQICLVTGASRGIGEGTAKVLAQDGVKCVVSARRMELLENLADEIESTGGVRPTPISADLFQPGATAKLAKDAEDAGQNDRADAQLSDARTSRNRQSHTRL